MMLQGCTSCGGCRPMTPCECLACKGFPKFPRGIGVPKKPPHDCSNPLYYNVLTGKLHFWDHVTGTWECTEACGTDGGNGLPNISGLWSTNSVFTVGPRTLRLAFQRDGTTTWNSSAGGTPANWAENPSATVGDGFWIKALSRAHAPGDGDESLTTGFWFQLNQERAWNIGRDTAGNAAVTLDFYLSTSAADSGIIKSWTTNVLNLTVLT